jgi:hypothetical protein
MKILLTTTLAFSVTLMIGAYQTAEAMNINQTLPHQNDTQLIRARGAGGHGSFGDGASYGGGAHVESHDAGTLGRTTGEVAPHTEESHITHRDINNINPNKWNQWEGWGAWSLGAGDEGGCTVDPFGNIDCGDTTE